MASLLVTKGQGQGQEIVLTGAEIMIGREEDCDIQLLDDSKISRHHAKITKENGVWVVADLDSANGTFVNGEAVVSAPLNESDTLTIGDSAFLFRADAAAAASEPAGEDSGAKSLTDAEDLKRVERMRESMDAIRREVGKVIIGQEDVLNQILMCIIAGGHALLIGLPGLAKTLTVNTLAKVLDMKFKRIQFTPDLMPSDITGTEVLETDPQTQQKQFRFMQGPIFCNILLAGEINRTPPKTQAALLEAMQEKQVSVGKEIYKLDKPFFVLATQNPIEQEGTFPLPEAQLDRFLMYVRIGYPEADAESEILRLARERARDALQAPASGSARMPMADVFAARKAVLDLHVAPALERYLVELVLASRNAARYDAALARRIAWGASPRGSIALERCARARAWLAGRDFVTPEDVRAVAPDVLRHRVLPSYEATAEGWDGDRLVAELLQRVPLP